ncbi:Non-specific lipid-transfer protein [Capsicum chinense]|nr:Non-specific lipid-transfer protein [Capsicum chinense]
MVAREKVVFQVIPIIILWFLWKRRNTRLHGDFYRDRKVIWEVNNSISKFIKLRFNLEVSGKSLSTIFDILKGYRETYVSKVVKWLHSPHQWLKANTDGASRKNLGPHSIAFYIREEGENLVVARGVMIQEATSLVAEAIAMRKCLSYCYNNSIDKLILKSDSWSLVQIIQGTCDIPWSVAMKINAISYLMGGSNQAAVLAGCCSGIQSLYTAASTTPDRQGVCSCLKSGAASLGNNIDTNKAATLLSKCGVPFPYKISANIDCSKIQ